MQSVIELKLTSFFLPYQVWFFFSLQAEFDLGSPAITQNCYHNTLQARNWMSKYYAGKWVSSLTPGGRNIPSPVFIVHGYVQDRRHPESGSISLLAARGHLLNLYSKNKPQWPTIYLSFQDTETWPRSGEPWLPPSKSKSASNQISWTATSIFCHIPSTLNDPPNLVILLEPSFLCPRNYPSNP